MSTSDSAPSDSGQFDPTAERGRIVVFGATGATGSRVARSMVAAGFRPVLAGRDRGRLETMAGALDPARPLPVSVADVGDPQSVRRLLEPRDVLVSTVGPFTRWGGPAVEAAVDAGAGYIDSTGEPPFVADIFEYWGPRAERTGARLLTACGYDYVPGNLAAVLAARAVQEAGATPVTELRVGYFLSGGAGSMRSGMSRGTLRSLIEATDRPGLVFRDGHVRAERTGKRIASFPVGGSQSSAISIGGTEGFTLPRLFGELETVSSYLGWFGSASRAVQLLGAAREGVQRVPGVGASAAPLISAGIRKAGGAIANVIPADPDSDSGLHTDVVAQAWGGTAERRSLLATSRVRGPEPYGLTADLITWAAGNLLAGRSNAAGALGPADAFGIEELISGCAAAGLTGQADLYPAA